MSTESSLPADLDTFSPLRWAGDHLCLLDQTRLPGEEVWLDCYRPSEIAAAIRRLAVRGAPAIGVAAAYGLVLAAAAEGEEPDLASRFDHAWRLLAATRPTAVNLRWALDQGRTVFAGARAAGPDAARAALLTLAERLCREDVEANRRIGRHGAGLLTAPSRVLTHCNTGALATAGYGTALGVIRAAWEAGRVTLVWVDETRPLLQGARLTAWELARLGIPHRLVTDSSAGSLLARRQVDCILVGADRIAANGDSANKIGTYPLAVLASYHRVPFYVVAPRSTIDSATPDGAAIPIEERDPLEVTRILGTPVSPETTPAANFAFDVTPAELITAIVTDAGVLRPPYREAIAAAQSRPVEAASHRRST